MIHYAEAGVRSLITGVRVGAIEFKVPVDCDMDRLRLSIATANGAGDTLFDIKKNGVTIYGDPLDRPKILAGQTESDTLPAVALLEDQMITVDVLSNPPGGIVGLYVIADLEDGVSGGGGGSGDATSIQGRAVQSITSPFALVDNFNDNSFDTAKWERYIGFDGGALTSQTVAETGGQLVLTTTATLGAFQQPMIRSLNAFTIADGGYVQIELVSTPVGATYLDARFGLWLDNNNFLEFMIGAYNRVDTYYRQASTNSNSVGATYNSSTMRFLRIRRSGSTLLAETSPNGNDTWTVQRTVTPSMGWTGLRASFGQVFSSAAGSGQITIFDKFLLATSADALAIDQTLAWKVATQQYEPYTLSAAGATGAAGGVLAGTYPNPSFAADMATQAELDALLSTVIASTVTGAQNNYAPTLSNRTLIEWSGASDASFTGIAGGSAGMLVTIKNTGTKVATFAHNSGSSSAGNKLFNIATSGPTPIAPGGYITYQHDGTQWQITDHEQGASITVPYAGGNFTASGSMVWTVEAGDVLTYGYYLKGSVLHMWVSLDAWTISGSVSTTLKVAIPGGFIAKFASSFRPTFVMSNAVDVTTTALVGPVASGATVDAYFQAGGNWAAGSNVGYLRFTCNFPVN